MNLIKLGIKLWSTNSNWYPLFVDAYKSRRVDYLELLYVPGYQQGLEILIANKIPIIVHAPAFGQKVLFGRDKLEDSNRIIQDTFNFAKKLNAEKVIVHPDVGNKEKFTAFLKANKDKKMIIENMPKIATDGSVCLGYTIEEIKEYLQLGNSGFCLDFGHAIKSALSQKIEYKHFLKKIIELKPEIIHLCGGNTNYEIDEHLDLDRGDFDLPYLIEIIKLSSAERITFEVPKTNGLDNDLRNIKYFKRYFE